MVVVEGSKSFAFCGVRSNAKRILVVSSHNVVPCVRGIHSRVVMQFDVGGGSGQRHGSQMLHARGTSTEVVRPVVDQNANCSRTEGSRTKCLGYS